MRIRKHSKISPLLYAAASHEPVAVLQTHVCRLNQSPWDVMEFSPPSSPPPPPSQANADAVSAGNASLKGYFHGGPSSHGSQQLEYSGDHPANPAATVRSEEPLLPPPEEENDSGKTIHCRKTDGKSWKCKREASTGNTMCDHHLSQAKSYNYSYNSAARKPDNPDPEARHTVRPKKTASSSSNPNEFYYYSGFGPRWGKKRGPNYKDIGEHDCKIEPDYGEPDYEESEEEEEDEEREEKEGRKRTRKPIKARSLKSLM